MFEKIIDELFKILKKYRSGWVVIIFCLFLCIIFMIWNSLPDKIKEHLLENNEPTVLHEISEGNSSIDCNESTNKSLHVEESTPEESYTSLTKSQIYYRIDKLISDGKFKEILPLFSNFTSDEKDRELWRLFNKLISIGDLETAKIIIPEFNLRLDKEKAQQILKMEEIKK